MKFSDFFTDGQKLSSMRGVLVLAGISCFFVVLTWCIISIRNGSFVPVPNEAVSLVKWILAPSVTGKMVQSYFEGRKQ